MELETCCAATYDEAVEWLQSPEDGARLLKALDVERLTSRSLRRVVDVDFAAKLDWHLDVRPISLAAAKDFNRRHHDHAPAPMAGWRFGGAIWNGDTMLGIVMVGRPASRVLQARDAGLVEVNRLCLDRGTPRDLRWKAASSLYRWAGHQAALRGYTRIQTYTLRDDESGMSLRYARWKPVGESKGGTWDTPSRPRKTYSGPTGRKIRWERKLSPTLPLASAA